MAEITSLFDIDYIRKLAKNIVPIISPVTFFYLYLKTNETYLLVLGLISLCFLTFYINLHERMWLVIGKKLSSIKQTSTLSLGLNAIKFAAEDKVYLFTLLFPFFLGIVAFIELWIHLIDIFTWILFLLCVLALFHYITALAADFYVGKKYGKILKKT